MAVRRPARRLADEHRGTRCVARTLTQQAMPTTLGFRVAGWLAGVHDALRAGAGVPAAAGVPRRARRDRCGVRRGRPGGRRLAGPDARPVAPVISWHTRRTPVLTLATALVAAGDACGRIGADLLLMGQTEVGEAADGSAGASSAMAHKANPTRSVLVASAARQLPALLARRLSGAGASERPAGEWHAEWQPLRTMLRLAGAAAERTVDIVADMSFDTGRDGANLACCSRADRDDAWAAGQTEHVGVWIDRVLARHEEVVG